jgi:carboxyl-terminal processing protease
VKSQLLESGYGYIRITQFQVKTGDEVGKALAKLRKDNGKKLNGIVLDLRNNPGGVLQSAVEVVDHFITKGLIVYTKGRIANSELRFSATGRRQRRRANGRADQRWQRLGFGNCRRRPAGPETRRADGHHSFGKGSVQTVLPLANDRALKITTALYYTPNGRSIQAQGIVPDIEVRKAKLTNEADTEYFKEADLQGHLGNGNGGADRPTGSSKRKDAAG